MATSTRRERPVRALVTLAVLLAAVFGALFAGARWSDASLTPDLALDLEGGTQIILTPVAENSEEITEDTIAQAIEIIRQRVDASGVAEAEITSQGGSNIVVALPGEPSEETLDLVRESARMLFRPVIVQAAPGPIADPTVTDAPAVDDGTQVENGTEGAGTQEGAEDGAVTDEGAATDDGATEGTTDEGAVTDEGVTTDEGDTNGAADALDPGDTVAGGVPAVVDSPVSLTSATRTDAEAPADEAPAEEAPAEEAPAEEPAAPTEPAEPTDASDTAWLTEELLAEFAAYDCTDPQNLTGGPHLVGDPDAPIVACDASGQAKYVLGPVELRGEDVAGATSQLRVTQTGAVTNEWIAMIDFNGEGTGVFRDITERLLTLEPPRNQFAMVLDGLVISAPSVNTVIPDGNAEISGGFTRESAGTLARQLNFGALPLTFEVQSEQQISATLGAEQLQKGLLAGLIGLGLVALYSIIQYRALGLVTVASLLVAGLLTYGLIALLSWTQGYRLSLPGVAGLIVAIGITADSFIVYFERIRDELREGRTLVAAVDTGWRRARRTILASDAVSFLAAVVLYFLAVGGVRGFAFTLGLTTLVDLVVVFLFTHPLMAVLARRPFFSSGHRLSGLDARALRSTSRYVGRGRVVAAGQPADRPLAGHGTGAADEVTEPALQPAGARTGATPLSAGAVAAGATSGRMTIAERRAAERRAAAERARERSDGEPSPDAPAAPSSDVPSEGKDG